MMIETALADDTDLATWANAELTVLYPSPVTALQHTSAFELLVATVLAAQTPDVRVNMVTPELFKRWPDPASLAQASLADVDSVIATLPLHRGKSANLITLAAQLVGFHNGVVPDVLDELVALAGVGRKTAQVVLGGWYNKPALPVDTHTARISVLLGLAPKPDAVVVERALRELLPGEELWSFHLRLVDHGRETCIARRPACDRCVLASRCPSSTAS